MIIKKDDICIDIETLGKGLDAVIVSIGATIFNVGDAPGTFQHSFDVKVDFKDQKDRVICGDTLAWWLRKDMEDARKAAFKPSGRIRLGLALKQLADFIAEHRPEWCWGCGPEFDMMILQHAYVQHKQEFPMPFWSWQNVRTIESFFYQHNTRKPGKENWLEGTAHDALDDCIMEISVLQKCWQASRKVTL